MSAIFSFTALSVSAAPIDFLLEGEDFPRFDVDVHAREVDFQFDREPCRKEFVVDVDVVVIHAH